MALPTNLVAYWKLDEASGNASDATGNGFTLTNTSATYGPALINNGANFGTALTAFLHTTSNLGINGGAISVSLWVKLNAEIITSIWSIFDHGDATTFTETFIRYSFNGGTIRLQFERLRSAVADDDFFVNGALGTTTWHHLVLTYDGTTVTGYKDGSSAGTVASSGSGTSGSVNGFTLNDDNTPKDIPGKTQIDEVGVWSRALTSSEVTQLYNAGAGLAYPFSTGTPIHSLTTLGVGA